MAAVLEEIVGAHENRAAPLYNWPDNPKAKIDEFGIEPPLDDTVREFQQQLRKFAVEVMRPIGQRLDKLTPEEVMAPDSEVWTFLEKFQEFGIDLSMLGELEPAVAADLLSVIMEELGYGDGGLAVVVGAGLFPALLSLQFGNEFLMQQFPISKLGCWGITEPDHGSDSLDPQGMIRHAGADYGRPNLVARREGDKFILNGQKSAWVSNGPTAQCCILYTAADYGDGAQVKNGCVFVLPLDLPGIRRGKPLAKLGQRALTQGELFFEDVEVSRDYLLAGPRDYMRAVYCIHTFANALMGSIWTGVARSAYHLAHGYAHERKQGGVPIYRHQTVALRLFEMFRKVEASAALTRRVLHYNMTRELPALQAAMAAKTTATETSFEVASDALGIFGGNGLTHEYPIEKIMRDARAAMIEDGDNTILKIKGGYYLMDQDLLG